LFRTPEKRLHIGKLEAGHFDVVIEYGDISGDEWRAIFDHDAITIHEMTTCWGEERPSALELIVDVGESVATPEDDLSE
jgi:hypothetical protein